MARPQCCRRVEGKPVASVFKPAGIPARELDEIAMTLDEFEAVRLADLEGLYQEMAAEKMGVSRSTFSRIVDAAHRKIAEAIVNGKALKIEGGPVFERPRHRCGKCSAEWNGPPECPRCKETGNTRTPEEQPPARCGRRRRPGWGKP
ncbi:MAG: hypothetical protein H6Q84_1932 [Deltaproteobacteria bacterium]|nr:hypothetical protein [Deltaproteobacteria bacterium]